MIKIVFFFQMQGLDDKEKGEMFCLFESALRVLSADDILNLKQTVEDIAEPGWYFTFYFKFLHFMMTSCSNLICNDIDQK